METSEYYVRVNLDGKPLTVSPDGKYRGFPDWESAKEFADILYRLLRNAHIVRGDPAFSVVLVEWNHNPILSETHYPYYPK